MTAAGKTVRSERASSTQEAILSAAERLYAEHGMFAVSNRQVSEAAGQGNNAAGGYHFGTKADLVLAIEQKHREPIEALREEMVAELGVHMGHTAALRGAGDDRAGLLHHRRQGCTQLAVTDSGNRRRQPLPSQPADRCPLRTK